MSLSALLDEQKRDIEKSRLLGVSHGAQPKPILFPRDYLNSRGSSRMQPLRAASTTPHDSDPMVTPGPRSASALGDKISNPTKSHLSDALNLTLTILKRHQREHRPISPEDSVVLAQIANFHADMAKEAADARNKSSSAAAKESSAALGDRPRPGSARDLVSKIRGIAHNPQMYKDMVSSKASVKSLTQFAVECSAKTHDLDALYKLISDQIVAALTEDKPDALEFELLVVDTLCGLNESGALNLVDMQRGKVVEAGKEDPLRKLGGFWRHEDIGYLPMAVDADLYAVARFDKNTSAALSEQRVQVLNAIAGVAALSIRTAAQFERLEWQRTKNAGMLEMVKSIASNRLEEGDIVNAVMESAKRLVDASHCSFHFVDEQGQIIGSTNGDDNDHASESDLEGSLRATAGVMASASVAVLDVARSGEAVAIHDGKDTRVDNQLEKMTGMKLSTALITPVRDANGKVLGVAQLSNKQPRRFGPAVVPQRFTKQDEELFQTYGSFAAISILNCRNQTQILEEKQKSDAVLETLKYLADSDIRDVQSVCAKVMKGAKELLGADRASLFLIDEERNELFSKIADSTGGKEIRFPIGKGIAGTVAKTGKAEIIDDAYHDDRFNKEVDKQLGYRTRTMLAEPILFHGDILAVAQLVNKLDKQTNKVRKFTKRDQETFRTFALFAGLSLSNSRLLEFVIRAGEEAMALNQANFEASQSPLSRRSSSMTRIHVTDVERNAVKCLQAEVAQFDKLTTTDFNLFAVREAAGSKARDMGCQVVIQIFRATGFMEQFGVEEDVLTNFVIRARNKYRNVPYHNFFHAVDAVQTVYSYLFIGKARTKLTDLEAFALLVAALCHDLDHMGLNNNFHLKTDSPLGILSSASGSKSVLEVHHCNLAIEILQDSNSNVFEGLDKTASAGAYRDLVDCILATDMARHGELLQHFGEVMDEGYDINRKEHRTLLMQMLLKAADISNVTKNFDLSRLWAIAVTEEFYQQGDKEREQGVDVAPMFDRRLGGELARGQIGFINFVAKKFFTLITDSRAVPGMKWTLDQLESNLATWQSQLS